MPSLNRLPTSLHGSPLCRDKKETGVFDYLDPKSALALRAVNKRFYAIESLQHIHKLMKLILDAKALVSSNATDVHNKIESFCKIGSELAKLGSADQALGAFQQASQEAARSVNPVADLCTIATYKSKAKLSESAKESFAQAKRHAGDSGYSLRTVAIAMAEVGLFDDALNIANNLRPYEDYTKCELLSKIGVAYGKYGHMSAAKTAFTEALKVLRSISNPTEHSVNECLSGVVADQISTGFLDEAEETAGAISSNERPMGRLHAFRDVAVAYAEARDVEYAGHIAANRIAIARNQYCPFLLGEIAAAQVSGGGIEQAETTLNRAKALLDGAPGGSPPSGYVYITKRYISALIKIGEFDKAKVEIKKYQFPVIEKSDLLLKIAAKQAQSGLTEQAEETFSEVLQIANGDTLPAHEREQILNRIIPVQADAGFFESAITIANDYGDGNAFMKCLKLGDVAVKQAKAGFSEQAQSTFEAALAEAERSISVDSLGQRDIYTYLECLSKVAIKQVDAGFIDEAEVTVKRLSPCHQQIGPLLHIATAHANEGQKDRARETFEQAKQLIEIPTVTMYPDGKKNALATDQAKVGFFSEATQTANTISNDRYRAGAFREIFDAQLKEVERIIELELKESPP